MARMCGCVLDLESRRGVEWVRVEIWKAQDEVPVAAAFTGRFGEFRLEHESFIEPSELFFKIFNEDGQIRAIEEQSFCRMETEIHVTLLADQRCDMNVRDLFIASLDELRNNEQAVINRLHALPNGGWLFFLNPLNALSEAGIRLTQSAKNDFLKEFPFARNADHAGYNAVRSAKGPQTTTITLQGIFKGKES